MLNMVTCDVNTYDQRRLLQCDVSASVPENFLHDIFCSPYLLIFIL